jgi:hypothetical protein
MKKIMMLLVCMVALAGLSVAQTYVKGTGLTGMDKLGAHQNGGRGCAGCHAPHSGGLGGGGNTGGAAFNDPNSGNVALFGQDVTPLYSKSISFGPGGYVEVLPASQTAAVNQSELTGIAFCLACHDGNVARGGMMAGVSYEQAQGELPANVYGSRAIPTLLGNDGTTVGNYTNDHPVGVNATLGKVGIASKFTVVNGALTPITTDASFTAFVNNYGLPSFRGRGTIVVPTGAADATTSYLVCTSCHTPHTMYVASASATNPYGGLTAGNFPTYFFLVGPYNPGSKPAANQASSATQFCRQCHYTGAGGSNEGSGILGVTTAF